MDFIDLFNIKQEPEAEFYFELPDSDTTNNNQSEKPEEIEIKTENDQPNERPNLRRREFNCCACSMKFNSSYGLSTHFLKAHDRKNKKPKAEPQLRAKQKVEPQPKRVVIVPKAEPKIEEVPKKLPVCHICMKTKKTFSLLREHIRTVHEWSKPKGKFLLLSLIDL